MPFIEVGPQRYFEASADVLAAGPRALDAATARTPRCSGHCPPPRRSAASAPELVAYHAPGQPASTATPTCSPRSSRPGASAPGAACRTLLLTAARAEIGTTTVLLNLAISAARQGLRVVVVDANLRRPALADRLGLPAGPGLTDVLAGEARSDAVRPTAQAGLFALSAGSATALLADETSLRDVVLELAAQYDLVLIDGPRIEQPLPAGRAWDRRAVSLLATACQAMYLVVPAAESETAATTDLAASLVERALPLAGCIVAA